VPGPAANRAAGEPEGRCFLTMEDPLQLGFARVRMGFFVDCLAADAAHGGGLDAQSREIDRCAAIGADSVGTCADAVPRGLEFPHFLQVA